MKKRTEEFKIKELLDVFIPKLWIIVIISLVLAVGMGAYSAFVKDDTYTSTTKIHVIKQSELGVDFGVNDVEFANSYLQTYIEVLKIPDFLNVVVEDFKENHHKYETYEGQYEDLGWNNLIGKSIGGYVNASAAQDLITVNVTTGNPNLSCGIANSIANVIKKGGTLAYPDGVIKAEIVQVAVPNAANSRRVVLGAIIGAAVGAILSMAVIFIFSITDVTIHDKKKLEDNFEIPILGVIPRFITEEDKGKK